MSGGRNIYYKANNLFKASRIRWHVAEYNIQLFLVSHKYLFIKLPSFQFNL